MNYYDDQLKELLDQCARKRKLESSIKELTAQRDQYAAQAGDLQKRFQDEQEDVDRLEGRSLAAFFYNVIGKKGEKLDKERQEAYAARVKYDAASRELAGAEEDLRRCQRELNEVWDSESQYQALWKEKIQAVIQAGGPVGEKILNLEERISYLEGQQKELNEAISAGQKALSVADQVLSSLDSAEGWGTWDLVGGGMLSDLAKHSHLDTAQSSVEHLQSQLRIFKTELADVTVDEDFQVSIDGFLRFADYFFDGIFTDWMVLDRIHQSQDRVQDTRNQIDQVLRRLEERLNQVEREKASHLREIDNLTDSVRL
ncbi:uncharacterized protein BN452_01021 [Clostridium sp. CAG:1013]|nr:uncharacterized protein BN452_01021 [Clostridium sp. CAG:1013]